jgi:hypothetical protein
MRMESGLIAEVTVFNAELFPAFGLPPTLSQRSRARSTGPRGAVGSQCTTRQHPVQHARPRRPGR